MFESCFLQLLEHNKKVKIWKIESLVKEKCTRPYVLTAVKNVKSHLSPRKEGLYIVKNAIRNTEDIEI